jgi:parvulin-like peptidyl-prolyl isomerase
LPRRPARAFGFALATAVALAAAGCNTTPPAGEHPPVIQAKGPTTSASADNPSVARINGITITRSELDDLLYRSYGINILADLVELHLAEQALQQKGLTLTDADVAAERQRSMERFFPNEKPENYDQDFRQLKAEKHLTDVEFEMGFRTTAALRKIVAPMVAAQVTDDAVRQAFGLLYGENRRIADITVSNVVQVAQVQAALKTEPFETVAKEHSIDELTSGRGGSWPPFSSKTPGVPSVIMEAAFGMKVGEVSKEPLVDGDRYHVIKLLGIIPPKVVQFDAVKAGVRQQVEESMQQQGINQARKQLQQLTVGGLTLDDPTLRKAWDAMLAAQQPAGKTLSAGEATTRIHAADQPSATRPATQP